MLRKPFRRGATRKRGRLAIVVIGALVACACGPTAPARVEAPADTAAGEVGFRLAGPNEIALIVPVHINGEGPLDFVLDTGATVTCVAATTAERLALPPRRGAVGVGVGIGGASRVGFVRVDSLRIGAARAFDMSACVLDLEHMGAFGPEIDGLVGLDFLQEFRVTLDFQRNILLLVQPDREPD